MSFAESNGSRPSGARGGAGARASSEPGGRQRSLTAESPLAPAPDPDLAVADLDLQVHAAERVDRLVGQPSPAVGAERLHRPSLDEQLAVAEPQLPVRPFRGQQVVGDHHDRDAELVVHALEGIQYEGGRCAVELRRRLVREQDHRQVRQRDGDRDALLFAARELARPVVRAVGEPHDLEQLAGRPARGGDLHAARGRGEPDVLDHAQVRDQVARSSLPHEAHAVSPVRGELVLVEPSQVATLDLDRAGGRAVQAADHVQDRRLARAAGAHDGQELALAHVEVDAAERDDTGVGDAIDLEHVPEPHERLAERADRLRSASQLGLDPAARRSARLAHSASPRSTDVTEERSSARSAASNPIADAATMALNETASAGQSNTRTGGGNADPMLRPTYGISSRRTPNPIPAPARIANVIISPCSSSKTRLTCLGSVPIARSEANSNSRRRCAKYNPIATPSTTSPSPPTAVAKFIPTASDCGSCASAPMIGPAACVAPGIIPACRRAGRGSSLPIAHTWFSASPGSGIRTAARRSAGVETTTKSPSTEGNACASATCWKSSRCPPIVATKGEPCDREISGEISAGGGPIGGAMPPTTCPAPVAIVTEMPDPEGVTVPSLPRHPSGVQVSRAMGSPAATSRSSSAKESGTSAVPSSSKVIDRMASAPSNAASYVCVPCTIVPAEAVRTWSSSVS